MSAYLDTHVVLWLYAGETERISKPAAAVINVEALWASPMVLLEMQYLTEMGRLAAAPHAVITDLACRIGLSIEDRPLVEVTKQALACGWTRDVFDRMIVSQAAFDGVSLVSSDRFIRKYYPKAVW